MITYSYIRVTY